MPKTYKKIAEVTLQHAYFQGEISRDLQLQPTPRTSQIMHQLDLRLAPQSSGFQLYWAYEIFEDPTKNPVEERLVAPALQETQPLVLSFQLSTSNPAFYNYTDYPFTKDSLGKKHHYAAAVTPVNRGNPPIELARVATSPTPPDEATAQLTDLKHFRGAAQTVQWALPPAQLQATLRDSAGRVVFSEALPEKNNKEGNYTIVFDHQDDWGIYELLLQQTGQAQVLKRFTLGYIPDEALPQLIGLFQLVIDPALLHFDETTLEAPVYQISFNNRSTHWRYYLYNKNQFDFSGVRLSLDQEVMEEVEHVQGNEEAPLKYTYTSILEEEGKSRLVFTAPRPLFARQPEKIKLELLQTTGGSDPKVLASLGLPTPNVQRIYPERTGEDHIDYYSDMHIYL